jgi:Holliday junction resolvase-like predicted endonuclease
MPIKNGTVFCVNHPNLPMVRNSGFNSLTTIQRFDTGFIFNPANGIPLVVFYCNDCGYVESYAAQKTSYWSEAEKAGGSAAEKAIQFEQAVLEALKSEQNPFGPAEVLNNVLLNSGEKQYEADVIVQSGNEIYVIEVKASPSRRLLESAAAQVRNNVDLYKNHAYKYWPNAQIFPVIVAPAESNINDEILGVPVLKFDLEGKLFVNKEEVLRNLKGAKGFVINVKRDSSNHDLYYVECWPRELQQPYKDGRPQPVPPFPKAEVDARGNELAVRWTVFPERFEKIKTGLEESVKSKVREYRASKRDS